MTVSEMPCPIQSLMEVVPTSHKPQAKCVKHRTLMAMSKALNISSNAGQIIR